MSTSITSAGTVASFAKALVLASQGKFNGYVGAQAQALQNAAVSYIDDTVPGAEDYDLLTLTTKIANELLSYNKTLFESQYPDSHKDYQLPGLLSSEDVYELSRGIALGSDGLRYLVMAANDVLHGQTPKMIVRDEDAGHPALRLFKQNVPLLLHEIESPKFSDADLSMARIGDDLVRVRSGGDDYYGMQDGLSAFLSTLGKETKHAIYYGNETLMHIIAAARTGQDLMLPEYNDAPRHKIKMKSLSYWSPNDYNVMSDIPEPDQNTVDRLNTVLIQTNLLIQGKPSSQFKHANGMGMSNGEVTEFKNKIQSLAISHVFQSQYSKYKYSGSVGYPVSKRQSDNLNKRSVPLLVLGRESRLQPLLDVGLDVNKSEMVNLIQNANHSKSTVIIKDSRENREALWNGGLNFAEIKISPEELSDLNKRYVRVTPIKQFFMNNVIIDLKKEYGDLLGVNSEFEPEQLATILSERWSKATGLSQGRIRNVLSEKILNNNMLRDTDITAHLYCHLDPIEKSFLDGKGELSSPEESPKASRLDEITPSLQNRR
jgi:hypothetical protein